MSHGGGVERALVAAEERYRSLVERIPDAIWTCDERGRITFATENIDRFCGLTQAQLGNQDLEGRIQRVHPDDRHILREAMKQVFADGTLFDIEYRRQCADGSWIWLRNRAFAMYERDGVRYCDGILSNVTERHNLEEGLRLAQKMEAIGQLTGGIAHDFNNILAAILMNASFLRDSLVDGDPRRAEAEEILASAQRGAALTRQLLAFSRRQVLEPTVVPLDRVVDGLEKMLHRLIGEDIALGIVHSAGVGKVRADVGQIEQVIMNLVVNARDAMPAGGRLTIETANVTLDGDYAAGHGTVVPGEYVMLAISDTGCGMSPAVVARIFEPFFTTKDQGKGTGLGLSTCYGIVKQSNGYIWAYSEPGHGSVFKVYLPRFTGAGDHTASSVTAALPARARGEVVLLVEDDASVRSAVQRMLEQLGYELLTAESGMAAEQLMAQHGNRIDIVLSDVVMPGVNGPDLIARLRQLRPALRTLLMSGYTDHAVLGRGELGGGLSFIQKPFTAAALARKLRDVLDQPPSITR
jgi:two-component system, cell cycle sensor histidine kinase and response regulator CckA